MSESNQLRNTKIKIYRATMLSVLFEFETWSSKVREEHRLRMFENNVLSKMSGAKRDEITGNCIKLHSEELHELYPSSNIVRLIKSRRM
jgi:hypothetical protein